MIQRRHYPDPFHGGKVFNDRDDDRGPYVRDDYFLTQYTRGHARGAVPVAQSIQPMPKLSAIYEHMAQSGDENTFNRTRFKEGE